MNKTVKKIIKYIYYAISSRTILFEIRKRAFHVSHSDIQVRSSEDRRLTYNKLHKKYRSVILNFKKHSDSRKKQSDYVWIFWEDGYGEAPTLIKACINSIKSSFKDKQVVVLSKYNLDAYIQLPDYIRLKHQDGKIGAAHYSDIVRIELLYRYGGLWIDSTVLCTSSRIPEFLSEYPLFVYKSLCLRRQAYQYTRCSVWLIYSTSYNDIIALTRELLLAYWKDFDYAIDYFILHIFIAMASYSFPKQWDAIPTYDNHTPHIMMFELRKRFTKKRWNQLLEISPIHKLERHTDFSHCRHTFYNHIIDTFTRSNNEEQN